MKYYSKLPCKLLSPYVKHYWRLKSDEEEAGAKFRCTPDGYIEMLFQQEGMWHWAFNQSSESVSSKTKLIGQFSKSCEIQVNGPSQNICVKFYPWGFYSLFGRPLDELTDKHIDLEDYFGGEINTLRVKLKWIDSFECSVTILENWLLTKLQHAVEVKPELLYIAKSISSRNGIISIKKLVEQTRFSQRWVQKEFSTIIGASPKQHARFCRNFKAVKDLRTETKLTEMAYNLGFSDQSHFIRDFKYFAGCSPTEYLHNIKPSGEFNNFNFV